MTFFLGLVAGLVIGYLFKRQIDVVVNKVVDTVKDNRKKDKEDAEGISDAEIVEEDDKK